MTGIYRHLPAAPLFLFVSAATLLLIFVSAPAAADDVFDSYWHDGLAELDGYSLTVSRYGEDRRGTAVMIYVTEPFSEKRRVKVNDPSANRSDTFDALKLNLVRDFQTGIYDYNTMVSVFSRSDDFSPSKISFSSAEWCGHVYDERLFNEKTVRSTLSSYFEDESGVREFDYPPGGITEDNLFILLRGLRGDFLKPGEKRSSPFLPGAYFARFAHAPVEWTTATVEREAESKEIEVPAGRFTTMIYTITISGGREGTFFVETDYPHKIVRWELPPDARGELTGTKRLAYWKLNGKGGESHLADLGLETPGN
jgi:hypothetical protein